MAASYGDDVSRPAETAREAVQWLYYAYLGAVKEQVGRCRAASGWAVLVSLGLLGRAAPPPLTQPAWAQDSLSWQAGRKRPAKTDRLPGEKALGCS